MLDEIRDKLLRDGVTADAIRQAADLLGITLPEEK